jgi:hypothetical protein
MKITPVKAVPCLNQYKGRKYYKFTVVTQVSTLFWKKHVTWAPVIAASASDAIELVREEVYKKFAQSPQSIRPVEFFTWGVKGGLTHRFSGWESMVGGAIMHRVTPVGKQRDWVEELA